MNRSWWNFAMMCNAAVCIGIIQSTLYGGPQSMIEPHRQHRRSDNMSRRGRSHPSASRALPGASSYGFYWRLPKLAPPMKRHDYPDSLCPDRARRRFPHFSYPPVTPLNWTTVADVTSIKTSTYEIVNPRPSYRVCDELELRITARNARNESKQYGGDYFRAKIVTKTVTKTSKFEASSSTDGEVVDHRNGSYSAYFTLKWAGSVDIVVTLMHASEAVYVLSLIHSEKHQPRQTFIGAYSHSGPHHNQTIKSYCNFQLRKSSLEKGRFCNMSNTRTGTPWFCERPIGVDCGQLDKYRIDGKMCVKESNAITTNVEQQAFTGSKVNIKGNLTSVIVIENKSTSLQESIASLRTCSVGHFSPTRGEIAGFYRQGVWYPSTCKMNIFKNALDIGNCLRNRQVYLFGDSTIRQLNEFYESVFKIKRKIKPSYLLVPEARVEEYNLTTMFAFHSMPVGRNSWSYLTLLEHIADRIDSIGRGGSPVVVVSTWAHFTYAPPWLFEQRIQSILPALERLLARNPRAVVAFKGANTRHHLNFNDYSCCSDWFTRDLEGRLRSIVLKHKRVGFLDAWDMSSAQTIRDDVHPKGFHISNVNNMLLTLLGCEGTPSYTLL